MSSSRGMKMEEREESPLFVQDEEVASPALSAGEKRKAEEDLESSGQTSFAPKKKGGRKPPGRMSKETLVNRLAGEEKTTEDMKMSFARSSIPAPGWYEGVRTTFKGNRGNLTTLERVKDIHRRANQVVLSGQSPEKQIKRMRTMIQNLSLAGYVDKELLKKVGLLTNRALHQIFDSGYYDGVPYPADLQADTLLLYQKWFSGDLDGQLLRGIKSVKRTKENKSFRNHSIEPDYEFRKSPNYVGEENGIIKNGMWWPFQICAVRDGVHGESEAGIHGQKNQGAFSVVISGKGYANIDNGKVIEYCGTEGSEDSNEPSSGTALLLKAQTKNQAIRVLRSAALKSQYAPSYGIRYDGLYRIQDAVVLDQSKNMHRFTMHRLPNQTPIRHQGDEKRPSDGEVKTFQDLQKLMAGRNG